MAVGKANETAIGQGTVVDAEFWHQRWADKQIGFHQSAPNPLLLAHIGALDLEAGARLALPLCGKTVDIAWLRHQGFRVVGVELSEIAVRELFEENDWSPTITPFGNLARYSAPGVDIFVGDFFEMSAALLGPVDAVFDRAALVALPAPMRPRYAKHLTAISGKAPQLLITFSYDQAIMPGPPFSVQASEVDQLYGHEFDLNALITQDVPGGLKGRCEATETAWKISPK